MAKGRVSGGTGINLKANFSVEEAKKNAQELIKALNDVNKAAISVNTNKNDSKGKVFDVKPLTEYQAGLLKIKQQQAADVRDRLQQAAADKRSLLERTRAEKESSQAKQNAIREEKRLKQEAAAEAKKLAQEQAAADKKAIQEKREAERDASLALQASLREERRIRQEGTAEERRARQQAISDAKQLAAIEKQAAEALRRSKVTFTGTQPVFQTPTKVSGVNPNAEIMRLLNEDYKKGVISLKEYNEEVKRLQANIDAKNQSVKNESASTNENTSATNVSAAAKKRLAEQLAAEKLRQQQSTAELKNNAREQLNAKGSLEQRKAALQRLIVEYGRLSVAERDSAAGQRMAGIIGGLRDQIKSVDDQTKTSGEGISGFFKNIGRNILSAVGPLTIFTTALAAAKELLSKNVEISDEFVDVQRTAKLSGVEVDALSDKLKKINTRTKLSGLLDIGFEGGRLGAAKEDIVDYIQTVDRLAVVLNKELPGGADAIAESFGKIVKIYNVAENEGISLAEAMNKVGSSQLEVAHSGGVTVKYLQDFTLGVAGTAASAKLSIPVIEAYAALLSNSGTIASSAAISITRLVNDLSVKRDKYYAIAQLADASLTVEKFNNLINTDTQAALALFFKGLKAGNPTQIEFNDRIASVGITTGKVSNAVKILAQKYDIFNEKLAIATKGYDEATSVAHNFELANNSLSASLDKISNKISNYFISPTLQRGLAGLLNSFTDTRTEAEKLTEEYLENKKASDSVSNAAKPLLLRYDELKRKVKLNTVEQTELRKITAELGGLYPDVVTEINRYGKALDINRGKIVQITKAQKDLLELQNRDALKKANKEFESYDKFIPMQKARLLDAQNTARSFMDRVSDLTGGDVHKARIQAEKDILTEATAKYEAAAKMVEKLGGKLTAAQKKVLYPDKPNKEKDKEKEDPRGDGSGEDKDNERTIEKIEADIKRITAENKKLGTQTDAFIKNRKKLKELKKELNEAKGIPDKGEIKENKLEDSAIKKAKDISDKIGEFRKTGLKNQKIGDEKELQAVADKYDKMRKEIDDFYNDPKTRGKKININGKALTRAEAIGITKTDQKNETDALIYQQETEKLKTNIDKRKNLYDDFEKYRDKVGTEKAKERFKGQIDTEKTYLSQLKEELEKLPTENRDSNQEQRYKVISDQISAQTLAEGKALDELLLQAATYQQTKLGLTQAYNESIEKLTGENNAAERAVMTKKYQEDLDNLSRSFLEKSEAYKNAAKEAIVYTREETIKQIAALNGLIESGLIPADQVDKIKAEVSKLKFSLKIGVDEGNLAALKDEFKRVAAQLKVTDEDGNEIILSKEDYQLIIERLADIKLKIDNIVNPSTGNAKNGFTKGLEANFKYLKGSTSEVAAGLSNDLGRLSGSFNELGTALGGDNTQAGYLLGTIGELAAAGSDAAGAFASFANGDIVGGITKAVSAVTKVMSLFKRTKEMNAAARKEVEDFYSGAISGERAYQELLAQRQIDTVKNNKTNLQAIRDEVEIRKKQLSAYKEESDEILAKLQGQSYIQDETYKHGTLFRRAQVNKTYASLAGKSFEQLSELLSQGKLEGDTKALVERLKELEQQGYEANKVLAELAEQTSEIFTGTTADSLTNSLADLFKSGKTGVTDLADFFKQTMDDAALSIFKNKVLAKAVENFYNEFDKAAQSGDELSADEIARLNGLFVSLTDDALKKFEDFKKITGSDLTGASTGISGKVVSEAITEGTANRLLGITQAHYDVSRASSNTLGDIYQMAMKQYITTQETAANTLRTANNTEGIADKLDEIISNTRSKGTDFYQTLRDNMIR